MSQKSERELLADAKSGNKAAITELFERHYPSSLGLARRILRCDDAAKDAVQTAYFSAFQHLDCFREDSSFKTWMARIVLNCCLMQLRDPWHRSARVSPEDPDRARGWDVLSSPSPTPEKTAWCQEIAAAHSKAVARLPRHLREVYTLHAVSGLSVKEVADQLRVTVPAAKARLFRARAGLRDLLRPVWAGRNKSVRIRLLGRAALVQNPQSNVAEALSVD